MKNAQINVPRLVRIKAGGDLLELGIDVGLTTVATLCGEGGHRRKAEDPPSQSCRQRQVLAMRYEFVSIHIGRFLASHGIRRWGRQCADDSSSS